ncbi:MAG: CHAT domain-containing protein [Sedimenticola sp.]
MTKIRTINFELLRHGPAHNQLLSPLTDYIALCGDYGATTINVPYEHRQFLGRLSALRYENKNSQDESERDTDTQTAQRQEIIDETAEQMARIFSAVPGFASELNDAVDAKPPLTHLQLVLSASELALLPFELAKVPLGCHGGEGNWLLMQNISPICITRQVRNVVGSDVPWNRKPRILFAHAGIANEELLLRHTQALIEAVKPWLRYGETSDEAIADALDEWITVLPEASVSDINEACLKNSYTHVHILAHGDKNRQRSGKPFGLRLRKSPQQMGAYEVVHGRRLAAALSPLQHGCSNPNAEASRPLLVTLASCDSANVKEVIYDGASFAHELHKTGIPLVIASQFPLSFDGSIILAQVIYRELLCGVDPRIALHQLRNRLYSYHDGGVHDWAALVAYAAFPKNLTEQLTEFRYKQTIRSIDVALHRLDYTVQLESSTQPGESCIDDIEKLAAKVNNTLDHIPDDAIYEIEYTSLKATVEKRKAHAYYLQSATVKLEDTDDQNMGQVYRDKSRNSLRRSMRHYLDATHKNMSITNSNSRHRNRPLHWTLTQYLCLHLILDGELDKNAWSAALYAAEIDQQSTHLETRLWANTSIAELYLLEFGFDDSSSQNDAEEKAISCIEYIVKYAHLPFVIQSTRRQLQRYYKWWCKKEFNSKEDEEVCDVLKNLSLLSKTLDSKLEPHS